MDLREAVVEPCRLDLRRGPLVLLVKLHQAVHFRPDVFWRAVLVDAAVVPGWVVRSSLVVALSEGYLRSPSKLVAAFGELLVACKQRVEFLDVAARQESVTLDEGEDALDGALLIADHGDFLVAQAGAVRNESRVDTALDQQLRHAAVQVVETFDQTCLDRPLSLQPFGEPLKSFEA